MGNRLRPVDRRDFLRKSVGLGAGAFFLGLHPDSLSEQVRPNQSMRLSNETSQDVTWEVEGRYTDACRCHVPCPCHFGMMPDYDTCDASSVYQIEKGRYEDVQLDGLLAIVVLGKIERIYLDEAADRKQQQALEEITRALAGSLLRTGYPLADNLEVKVVPIRATLTDERAEVTVPGLLDIRSSSLTGGDGESRIEMNNLDLGPAWMESVWAGQASVYTHSDGEIWDYSGRNSYFGRLRANSNMAGIQTVVRTRQA